MSEFKIIPPETYKFIEAKLHSYDSIRDTIEEWELSVKYPENRQKLRGVGYISDPTANIAIKLAEPPRYIRELKKWLELIEQTRVFCERHDNSVFDIWYGKGRQSVTRAYTRNGIRKKTFEKNRSSAVSYLLFRAIDEGLCRLKAEKAQKENND